MENIMQENITFTHYGKTYTMTREEIEAAYRYQEKEYHKQDVATHWFDMYGDANEDECPYSDKDLAIIAERADKIMSKNDSYWDCYWFNYETAIEDFESHKCM